MKLNLGCGNDIRSGYINIDLMPPGEISRDVYKQGDIASLDWLVKDGTVKEIVAIDCLEYLKVNQIKQALENWMSKLQSGGTIKILVPDCHAVAQAFVDGQFDASEYNKITFGTQEGNDNRNAMIDRLELQKILEGAGLTIDVIRYEGVAVYVEAIK